MFPYAIHVQLTFGVRLFPNSIQASPPTKQQEYLCLAKMEIASLATRVTSSLVGVP